MGEELLFTAVAQHLLTHKRAPEILIEQMNSRMSQQLKEMERNPTLPTFSTEQTGRCYPFI